MEARPDKVLREFIYSRYEHLVTYLATTSAEPIMSGELRNTRYF